MPTAHDITASPDEDTQVIITLRSSDIDSPTVNFTILSGPNHGSLGLVSSPSCTSVSNGDGTGSSCTTTLTYTPQTTTMAMIVLRTRPMTAARFEHGLCLDRCYVGERRADRQRSVGDNNETCRRASC
jgi:hypothetical protein